MLVDGLNAVESVGVNTAVIAWVAAGRVDVVNVAVPLVTGTALPNAVAPSMNCTVPAAVGVTVAVNVTEVPAVTGLTGLAVTVVVVAVAPEPPPTGEVNWPYTCVHVVPVTLMSVDA